MAPRIRRLVDLSKSKDPEDRLETADNLCPCHVRRQIDEVWDTLYRLREDPDLQVRKAAFHTLRDGGDPSDPALDPIHVCGAIGPVKKDFDSAIPDSSGPRPALICAACH